MTIFNTSVSEDVACAEQQWDSELTVWTVESGHQRLSPLIGHIQIYGSRPTIFTGKGYLEVSQIDR